MAALPETTRATDLYERFAPRLYGFCLHKLGNREEAEDAVQTTFLNAFRGLSRGVVPESESAWLFKIAENVCLSRHRASFRRRRVEAPGGIEAVETVPAPQRVGDELIPLEEALAEIPAAQRHALLLREWQGLSYREIAARLSLSQSAVETLIFRARRSLARRLEAPRERLRRVGQAVDLGSLLAALKGALSTGAAVKAVAAGLAVTGLAVGVAVDRPQPRRHDAPQPAAVVPAKGAGAQTPARADAPLARAPETSVAVAASEPVRTPQSHSAKPTAGRKPAAPKRAPARAKQAGRESSAPSSPAASPPPPSSSASAQRGKAHDQQAARGRSEGKPAEAKPAAAAKPDPQPKPKAVDPEQGQPAEPGEQDKAKGKDK